MQTIVLSPLKTLGVNFPAVSNLLMCKCFLCSSSTCTALIVSEASGTQILFFFFYWTAQLLLHPQLCTTIKSIVLIFYSIKATLVKKTQNPKSHLQTEVRQENHPLTLLSATLAND